MDAHHAKLRPVLSLPAALAAFLALLAPQPAAAQVPVTSFDQLGLRLRTGDTVWITDVRGREVKGTVTSVGEASVTLMGAPSRTFLADGVRLIRRASKPVGRAAVRGLIVGGMVGTVLGVVLLADCGYDCGNDARIALAMGGIGAGVGAGAGAALRAVLPAARTVVYRASGASAVAGLSIAPVITPQTAGVSVSFAF